MIITWQNQALKALPTTLNSLEQNIYDTDVTETQTQLRAL